MPTSKKPTPKPGYGPGSERYETDLSMWKSGQPNPRDYKDGSGSERYQTDYNLWKKKTASRKALAEMLNRKRKAQ